MQQGENLHATIHPQTLSGTHVLEPAVGEGPAGGVVVVGDAEVARERERVHAPLPRLDRVLPRLVRELCARQSKCWSQPLVHKT